MPNKVESYAQKRTESVWDLNLDNETYIKELREEVEGLSVLPPILIGRALMSNCSRNEDLNVVLFCPDVSDAHAI